MSYDNWKLRAPEDEYPDYDDGRDDDADECDHDDYEVDILTGRAHCNRCPHSWYQTEAQVIAEIDRIRAYDEWQREQERPWYRFKQWIGSQVDSLRWRLQRIRKPRPVGSLDDEIPF